MRSSEIAGIAEAQRVTRAVIHDVARLPWPSTARIIVKGSFGFLRQILRSRALGPL